jgi:broad specificity phosphatase PhoE
MTRIPDLGSGIGASRLYLVRHGESTWNAAGLLQGRTGHVPLSARGRAQAAALARRLSTVAVAGVHTSDQLRCLQTAGPIAAVHGLRARPDPALREQGHGSWEGRPARGRAAVLAGAGPDWAPPGGETARALYRRAAGFLAGLASARWGSDGAVVVVSHGETIRALLAVLSGRGAARMPDELPGNGQITIVETARTTV